MRSPSPRSLEATHHGVSSSAGDLAIRAWEPSETAHGEIIFTHGLGEHSGRYGHVAAALVAHGFRVVAYDLYGHGRSAGARGDVPCYDQFLHDLSRVTEWATARYSAPSGGELPRFFMGHSLGGQITLRYVLDRQPPCAGVIASAPWLRLALAPSWWRLALARATHALWPAFRQRSVPRVDLLSADAEHWHSLPEREWCHRWISARLFFAVERAGQELLARAPRFTAPLLLLQGGQDAVTSGPAAHEFYEHAGSAEKAWRHYPESRHEPHNDLARARVLHDLTAWVEQRRAASAR